MLTKLDLDQVRRFCLWVHRDQVRKFTGDKYAVHPFRCEAALAMHHDVTPAMRAAMLLHDGPEDQKERCPLELIEMLFGSDVRRYVDELTNRKDPSEGLTREQQKTKDREHLKGISKEAKLMKLIDRRDNIRECSDCVTKGLIVNSGWLLLYCTESKALLPIIAEGNQHLAEKLAADIDFLEGQAMKLEADK